MSFGAKVGEIWGFFGSIIVAKRWRFWDDFARILSVGEQKDIVSNGIMTTRVKAFGADNQRFV